MGLYRLPRIYFIKADVFISWLGVVLSGRDLKEHLRILTEFRKIDPWMHIQTVYAL